MALPHLGLSLALAMAGAARAADEPPAAAPPAADTATTAQRVEIQGSTATGDRLNELSARITVTRDTLLKFGDRSLRDVLRRLPGVTVDGSDVRLRGLGSGYTQVLIDGEPAPANFSLDSLDPEMIERIEILRAPVAEHSMRAIAGSLNIVLRKRVAVGQRGVKLGVDIARGRPNPSASVQGAQQIGALALQATASLSLSQPVDPATITDLTTDASGHTTSWRRTAVDYRQRSTTLNLTPRLTWKDDRQTVSAQLLLQHQTAPAHWTLHEDTLTGEPSDYPASDWRNHRFQARALRAELTWTRRLGDTAQIETRLGLNRSRRDTDFAFQGFASVAAAESGVARPLLDRAVRSNAVDDSLPFKGKFSQDLGDRHRLALGWDGALVRRAEQRAQRDHDVAGELTYSLDQDYTATVRQLALFAQDEWRVQPGLEVYLGLRWEGLDTQVSGLAFTPVHHRASVPSPVAQLVWKLPDRPREQLRLALSRTYKAPATASLVPRRYTVNNANSPANPDTEGNPGLRPELAWGLDAAFESGVGRSGFWSASAHLRRIDQVVMRRLFQDGSEWVSTQVNDGSAWAWGAALEWKAPLREWRPEAPAVNLGASLSWNGSRLDRLAGPHNVLAAQRPLDLQLSADWTLDARCSVGGSFAYRAGVQARLMPQWDMAETPERSLDLYALWKLDGQTQLRWSAVNLLRPVRGETTRYQALDAQAPLTVLRRWDTATAARMRLQLERVL